MVSSSVDQGGSAGEMYVVDSPYEVQQWRPLVNWVLYIPHAVIQNGLRGFASAVFFIYWLVFLFTGQLNRNLFSVLALHERYSERASSFLMGFTETYPPFDFNMGGADNGAYPPIRVNLPEPPETTSRWAALNFLAAIPHYIVLAVFGVGAFVVAVIGWFAVLFTGAWPQGMRDFIVRYTNYYLRVWAFVVMSVNDYPRFGL